MYPVNEQARFWTKVDKTDKCWNWKGCLRNGYGLVKMKGKMRQASRVAFELVKGEIPDGLEIDHICQNTLCVNPDHLEAVTHRENVRRIEQRIPVAGPWAEWSKEE
jgi:HNH endonuclease